MAAEIRIINLPTRTPVLSSDYFIFEKELSPGTYVSSKELLEKIISSGATGPAGATGPEGPIGADGATGATGPIQNLFYNESSQELSISSGNAVSLSAINSTFASSSATFVTQVIALAYSVAL